ncbi:MAG: hypothetical protein AAGG55_00470 [Pseudomonadota bacterium]
MRKLLLTTAIVAAMANTASAQSGGALTCDDLVWSAQVLASNPDVGKSCQGVYERAGKLYAKVEIELVRARGNRLTFKTVHTDGSMGNNRSVMVPNSWRASIDGEEYRSSELLPGQKLNVYLPEDRFALLMDDGDFGGDEDMIEIEEATVVSMPKTASPLFAVLAAGFGMLGLGGVLTAIRHRRTN